MIIMIMVPRRFLFFIRDLKSQMFGETLECRSVTPVELLKYYYIFFLQISSKNLIVINDLQTVFIPRSLISRF